MAASDAALPLVMTSRAETSQSKRDRKRQVVMDRLAVLNERFQHDKDSAYRDQLQRIQLELNRMQKFDPYASNAIEVAADIQRECRQTPAVRADNARSLMDMAGLQFPQFMSDVQDVLEARDFQLTQSKNDYDRKVQEYKNTHMFKMETAKREHDALSSTMRDRLVNQLNTKKARLMKEKEAFEMSDSNALLLNPAQFSLTNPGSPGGHAGKRSTRNRKEADNHNHDAYGNENKKRKRNGGDDDGSPAPTRRALDPSVTTAYWQSEKARVEARKQGVAWSIASLFTEKELSMHYNAAALASHNHILRHRTNGNAPSPQGSDSGNGDNEAGEGEAIQLSAPTMERQPSHATRSTRVTTAQNNYSDDKFFGIEGVGNYELPSNLDLMHGSECTPRMPAVPPYPPYTKANAKADPSLPSTLSEKEVLIDSQIMACLKQYDLNRLPGSHLDNPKGLRKTFEAVSVPYQAGRFVSFTKVNRGENNETEMLRDSFGVGIPTSGIRDQQSPGRGMNGQAGGGTPMSRQSSAGGVAMSRQGTAGSGRGKTRRG
ncbi:hypothetical protein CP533_3191 [Ophiocordyceps camponoti-saundersi (nom. inval.)]|nr:hypothetical protein CP533_3191 [Ophiocordyceps camponoti-saundersi (nom. inval.)]